MFGKGENMSDFKRLFKLLPQAVWDGAIEAGKVHPLPNFGLGFLKSFQDGLKEMKAEKRGELAKGLKAADLPKLISDIEEQTKLSREQGEVLARILTGVATLIESIEPTRLQLLNVVSCVETLPNEVLRAVREEWAKERGEVVRQVADEVVESQRKEEERKRKTEHASFEDEYLKAIKQTYGYMELLGIPSYSQSHPIDAGFVSLSLDGGGYRGLPAESVLRGHPRLVIVGDAGAGKTTLMQWESVRCCDGLEPCEALEHRGGVGDRKENSGKRVIPFFIRLRNFMRFEQNAFPDPDAWVKLSTRWLATPEPARWLDSVLREGRALLILDGLDELPPEKRPKFWKSLQACLNLHSGLRFRVTSRPFPHDDDKADQWQIPKDKAGQPASEVRVLELAPDRVLDLIEQWHRAAVAAEPTEEFRVRAGRELDGYADRLKRKLREPQYARLYDLAKTPFFCAAICLINRYRKQLLPEERHELYRMLVEALLGLRNRQREIVETPPYDSIKDDVWFRLHARLALDMMTSGMKKNEEGAYLVEIDRKDAVTWVSDYIETLPALRGKTNADGLLDYMMTRCGLLREPAQGRLDFRHRALQEYLAGSAAILFGRSGQLVSESHDDRWRDTIILAAGGYNVGDQEVIALIKALVERGQREKLDVCFAVAVACLETAGAKVDATTQDLALAKLSQLLPPRDSERAKVLSAAGDRVVPFLAYEDMLEAGIDALLAAAESLRRIGSAAAQNQLRKGYLESEDLAVSAEVVQCPGIHPLDVPAILNQAKAARGLVIPRYARPYLKDLNPLKTLPDLQSLDVSDCRELANIHGLSALKDLRALDLSRCEIIADLSSLADMLNLESLSLRCCEKITDLAPLKRLTNLQTLDLANCGGIRDLSPLESLGNLRSLDLQGIENARYPSAILKTCSKSSPGADFIETTAGLDLQMVWIPGGEFRMGGDGYDDEKPILPVTLEGFWLSKYAVTQAQYEALMGTNPSHFKDANNPVEQVSWNDAKNFCQRLSEKTGQRFVLPSEAQWEYACRAGSTTKYCFGDSEEELGKYAWYSANSEGKTHPVGTKEANKWGLYDVHGNVWEWVEDDWHESYRLEDKEGKKEAPDNGKPWVDDPRGGRRVLRGGGWYRSSSHCRSAYRNRFNPGITLSFIGFRLARTC